MDKIQGTSAVNYYAPARRQGTTQHKNQVSDGINLIDIRRNNNIIEYRRDVNAKPSAVHKKTQKKPVFQDTYEFSNAREHKLTAREKLEIKRRKQLLKVLGIEILAGAGIISKLLLGSPVSGSELEVKAQPLIAEDEINYEELEEKIHPDIVQIDVNSDGAFELARYSANVNLDKQITPEAEIDNLPPQELIIYTQQMIDKANEILDGDEELKNSFNEIVDTVTTFTDQLGEDGYQLIKSRLEELGEDKVTIQDVLKILTIETHGNIYKNGKIIVSYTGKAFGPFQLTPSTISDINDSQGFTGTENELDLMDPYDNLDACIYQLKFLVDKNTKEIEDGKKLPCGSDVKKGMAWRYHDGAYASKYSEYGKKYVDNFERLSEVEKYPELIEYMDYLLSGEVINPDIEII